MDNYVAYQDQKISLITYIHNYTSLLTFLERYYVTLFVIKLLLYQECADLKKSPRTESYGQRLQESARGLFCALLHTICSADLRSICL